MSIRLLALYVGVAGLSIYAWKDWFKSLCGLIVITAIMGHPDFAQSIGRIQGCNVWNILFANVFLAWLVNRRRQGLVWDMPAHINVFLVLWLGVILAGWLWMIFDRSRLTTSTPTSLISEQLINTIKWPVVGLLLFDSCRTHHRIKATLACIVLFFVLFAVQIGKSIPPGAVREPGNMRARRNLVGDAAISPNGAAKMMSGVPWAMLAIMPLLKKRKYRFMMLGLCALSCYALALTGGRSGYVACGATAVLLCVLRWRRYLLGIPLAALILYAVFPGAAARAMMGFGQVDITGTEITNLEDVTAGRSQIWPVVTAKIVESPVIGFGRESMRRTGLQQYLEDEYGEAATVAVAHPHNAYLEVLLDSGIVGFIIIVGLHAMIWVYSIRLFVDWGDPLYASVGGVALSLLTGHLVSFMGGQSFYAEQIDVGLWCAIGIMLRLYVDRAGLAARIHAQSISAAYMDYDEQFPRVNTCGWE